MTRSSVLLAVFGRDEELHAARVQACRHGEGLLGGFFGVARLGDHDSVGRGGGVHLVAARPERRGSVARAALAADFIDRVLSVVLVGLLLVQAAR